MSRFIQIDEEGYFSSAGVRVTDTYYGRNLFENLRIENRAYVSKSENLDIFVEAFDEPLVALSVESSRSQVWTLFFPYEYTAKFSLDSLVLDEWDRFHGRTKNNIPFVLSRSAQMQLFDLVDTFDDDSITVSDHEYKIQKIFDREKMSLLNKPDISSSAFWTESYNSWSDSGTAPGWELGSVAKPLTEVIPQIKIPRSKICILGCGTGHDAAYLAALGHIVTAVDISAEAIAKAKAMNPETSNLHYVCSDAFSFAKKNAGTFDLVFEHTFFCAIDPDRRKELVAAWNSLLSEYGHFIGIFFTFDHCGGPPFAASEWEVRERMKKNFEFLYWTRWRTSVEKRLGKELIVYARKRLRHT